MLKINFYVCVSKFTNKTVKCINSIINQSDIHKIQIYIIYNSFDFEIKKYFLKKFKSKRNVKINILIEKKRGIPFARNRCLKVIRATKNDFSCFVDDDCELSKVWLKNMLKFYEITKSDVITGPQISKSQNIYEVVLERSIKNFTRVKWAATNNVFMKSNIIKKTKINFDIQLSNLGGEDQVFFYKLHNKGISITWNEDSKVYEYRDQNKTNLFWFIKRNIRYGSSSKILYLKIFKPLKAYIYIFLKLFSEILRFLIFTLLIPLSFKRHTLASFQYIIRATGTFLSLFNFKFNEYKN
tara:strand:- start:182 stop:1072 length:891 start_codon:yes stop_codon:yes gene_type:complete